MVRDQKRRLLHGILLAVSSWGPDTNRQPMLPMANCQCDVRAPSDESNGKLR